MSWRTKAMSDRGLMSKTEVSQGNKWWLEWLGQRWSLMAQQVPWLSSCLETRQCCHRTCSCRGRAWDCLLRLLKYEIHRLCALPVHGPEAGAGGLGWGFCSVAAQNQTGPSAHSTLLEVADTQDGSCARELWEPGCRKEARFRLMPF